MTTLTKYIDHDTKGETTQMSEHQLCPCGTGQTLRQCCGPALSGEQSPVTAEALMRSRYTAFVLGDTTYLAASWHSQTRPADASAPAGIDWRRLRIRNTQDGGADDETGIVEFMAHFRTAEGQRDVLHERSSFAREHGRWVYVSGDIL